MSRSSSLRLRATVVAVAASACLLGGVAAAEATPAAPAGVSATAATESASFTANGYGYTQSAAVSSAAEAAFAKAQRAGWLRSQCYLRGTDIKPTGTGAYSVVAEVFCQR
ncbi:hypothetical protein [Streptomyces sp. XY431]|uniref:hypothetical protein n=1 Tax=Streptomyces sp. XY431 TaxID=1415562 RepID=UPI0006AE2F2F|nr:hypothetical protein [Streptomyces sp. XY431]